LFDCDYKLDCWLDCSQIVARLFCGWVPPMRDSVWQHIKSWWHVVVDQTKMNAEGSHSLLSTINLIIFWLLFCKVHCILLRICARGSSVALICRGGAQACSVGCTKSPLGPSCYSPGPPLPYCLLIGRWIMSRACPIVPSTVSLPSHSSLSHLLGSSVVFGGGSGVLLGFGGVLGCSRVYNRLIRNRYKKNLLILIL
jgi:hypothetical protein